MQKPTQISHWFLHRFFIDFSSILGRLVASFCAQKRLKWGGPHVRQRPSVLLGSFSSTGPLQGPQMDPKWIPNGSKMDPKWNQNGPKLNPKWSQNWTSSEPKMEPKRKNFWTQIHLKRKQNNRQGGGGIHSARGCQWAGGVNAKR